MKSSAFESSASKNNFSGRSSFINSVFRSFAKISSKKIESVKNSSARSNSVWMNSRRNGKNKNRLAKQNGEKIRFVNRDVLKRDVVRKISFVRKISSANRDVVRKIS